MTEFDWRTLFAKNETPYFAMFRAGCMGISLSECIQRMEEVGLPAPREKDVRSWSDGNWEYKLKVKRQTNNSVLNPVLRPQSERKLPLLEMKLSELDRWPSGWYETYRRWFPCNEQGMPMYRWGYTEGHTPTLYDRKTAQSLSPKRWVGQNMIYQPFIVLDIDGVDHGERDDQVIEFGNRWRDYTETWENPEKPGSFHIYLSTPHIIPIAHFTYAKLDLMGNQKNAAVYTKDKISNGIPRAELTEEIWEDLKQYVNMRKSQREIEMRKEA